MNKKSAFGIFLFLFLISSLTLLFCGCTIMLKVRKLGIKENQEMVEFTKLTETDVINMIDPGITLKKIKEDPVYVRGKYVRLKGKANIDAYNKIGDEDEEDENMEGAAFLLDDVIVVWFDKNVDWLKDGDYVEVIGKICSNSAFNEMQKAWTVDEDFPDYEVLHVKIIKKINGNK